MLVAGSPLQIYHPNKECEYMLVAMFVEIKNGIYEFIDLSKDEYLNLILIHIN